MHLDNLRDAVASIRAARETIAAASARRAEAIRSAQHMIDNARATEQAEKRAAQSELQASIRRLTAVEVAFRNAEARDVPPDNSTVSSAASGSPTQRPRTRLSRLPVHARGARL